MGNVLKVWDEEHKKYIPVPTLYPGENYKKPADGEDGFSPTVSIENIEGGTELTITDVHGEHTVTIENGRDGRDGVDGTNGEDGTNGITPHIGENGNWYVGETDTGKPSRGAGVDEGLNAKIVAIVNMLKYMEECCLREKKTYSITVNEKCDKYGYATFSVDVQEHNNALVTKVDEVNVISGDFFYPSAIVSQDGKHIYISGIGSMHGDFSVQITYYFNPNIPYLMSLIGQ